ncbi:MAG: LysM peptidoglycan-binding domain-containing protein, partial [Candidatus Hydrogenedentes bacterium]|nr:LysM peptidoglycan-binding domain-containing protein [Candidatus Hydrogenedentota bacterium]
PAPEAAPVPEPEAAPAPEVAPVPEPEVAPAPEMAPEPEEDAAPAPDPEAETAAPAEVAPMEGQPAGTKKVIHTVARGDFPGKIADKYNVSVDDFFKWNNLTKKSTLHVGDEYVVYVRSGDVPALAEPEAPADEPAPAAAAASDDGDRIVHVVGKGDNPWSLSRKYGVKVQDIYDWNKWERGHTLHIGDEVILYKKGR